jgi:hypothetical protein
VSDLLVVGILSSVEMVDATLMGMSIGMIRGRCLSWEVVARPMLAWINI